MERIQHALQHFKESHGKGPHTGFTALSSQVPVPLVYTRTRTVIPSQASMAAHRVVTTTPGGPFLEAFKILRVHILPRLQAQHWNVVGVTSPGRTEGKTLVSVNFAICLAMEPNHTALLIDGNLRAPYVHQVFGIENKGLADFLLDQVDFSDLLVHPQIDRFVVCPAGGPVQHSAEALTLPKMASLAKELKTRYASRIVVVDLPPLLDRADVLGLAPLLDAMLLVVEAGRTKEKDVEASLSLLDGHIPILGTVLNKAR
jgi:protein-tyrosine kinase